jgi:recombination protein RecT
MAQGNEGLLQKLDQKGALPPMVRFENSVKTWLGANGASNMKKLQALTGSKEAAQDFVVNALTCINALPQLLECTFQSFTGSLLKAAQLGLVPGPMGECAIIPFRNKGKLEAQMIPQYGGLCKLALQSGFITGIWAEVVREKDAFDYMEGLDRKLVHKKAPGSPEERGGRVCVYACYRTAYGNTEFTILWPSDIESIKKKSRGAGSDFSPWNEKGDTTAQEHDWMWKKSAIKQLLKLAPKSKRLNLALMADNKVERPDLHQDAGFEVSATIFDEISSTPEDNSAGEAQESPQAEPTGQ